MDKIKIKDLELYCHHGVYPEENTLGQKFLISVELEGSTREAGQTDDLKKSIHYGEVIHFIKDYMKNHIYKLLETVAEKLAESILLRWEEIENITLEIKKPWAPVGLPLDTVSVEITRGWHTVFLGMGSNMGDKKAFLDSAVQELQKIPQCKVVKISDFIETEPYGMVNQDKFLNGAVMLRTLFSPKELITILHEIENKAHRIRTKHWGPRTLDLDILFYDDMIMDTEELHIPHIDMQNRDFVLTPLAQIAPYIRHPILNKTIEQLKGERNG